jgi:trehalose-phosphatase
MRRRLERLVRAGRCRIAVISGRALPDIRDRVGIAGIVYGGNHGLEVEGAGVMYRCPVPFTARRALDDVRGKLEKALSPVPGVFLEDKGISLTVHFRKAKRGELPVVAHAVEEAAGPYRMPGGVDVRPGKEVFEVRPFVAWNKGKTVQWLLEEGTAGGEAPLPVCVGDDRTDEDAFRAVRDRGVTVFVGAPRQTKARYYLKNIGEVAEFFRRLARIRKG